VGWVGCGVGGGGGLGNPLGWSLMGSGRGLPSFKQKAALNHN
jgi:hypothetical protein